MRDYQPIWEALKRDKVVSITTNKLLHPRIIKAVTKEKWMDLGYKIEIEPSVSFLESSCNGSIITFTLTLMSRMPNKPFKAKDF